MTRPGTISELSSVAREAALQTGEMLMENYDRDFSISKKGRVNLVTDIDLKAEEMIIGKIRRRFPDHQILAEERGSREGTSDHKWIIDPLDGTTNYAHGFRFFCISIALEVAGDLVLGVIYDPVTKELFTAEKGMGAFLNNQPIRVTEENNLIDSLLTTGFSYDSEEMKRNLVFFGRVMLNARAVRRPGSAALDLCYVACGRFDGYWEVSLNPWDIAAGTLIVREAGGRVTKLDGSECTAYDREILASNGGIHEALMELLGE
ncbi:MAG: inositol monophosphatase family protein [Acidobacteriota bacterium]